MNSKGHTTSAMNFSTFSKYSSGLQNGSNNISGSTSSLSSSLNLSSSTPSYIPTWMAQSNHNNAATSGSQFQCSNGNANANSFGSNHHHNGSGNFTRNRYAPYQSRSFSAGHINVPQHIASIQPLLNQSFCGSSFPYSTPPVQYGSSILSESNNFNSLNSDASNRKISPLGTCNNNNNNMISKNFQPYNMIASGCSSNSSLQSHGSGLMGSCSDLSSSGGNSVTSNGNNNNQNYPNQPVTLQINNLDFSLEEHQLRSFILNQLKPITPVISLNFEGSSCAKVTVPDLYYAKQVVSNLHRKKIGHKRVVVSYTKDSSSTEITTLRCQVAGLLKDVPYCTLPMYKFRELFQSRFKTSISVLDLYKMQDICNITADKNDDKHISLNSELITSIENNPLMEGLHESVPYCSLHFQKEQHKGWAEQEIEPLPNVFMSISEMSQIICPLLKSHSGDIPISSLVYCIAGELGIQINRNENGVNLEHLICCVSGVQISNNNFGIKVLGWLEPENVIGKENNNDRFMKGGGSPSDPLYQISKEVIELIKMSPKSTMKFNRFIPAYHNHFGKQCRVADYGYTKLIELFEALSSVVQIMGDGENRQITLTHRTQIRRFTTDLLRIMRSQGNKSILLSHLSEIFAQSQSRVFDITDYGVCAIEDILDGLANSNIIVVTPIQNGSDIMISIPKRKQTILEIEKTCAFAGEVVELFCNAPQYSILFQKFVRSYHYHFGYQCRLSDYGFLKLADLMEAIQGVVEIELTNDEDKKIFLSPKIARRVFAEQLEELIKINTGAPNTCMKLDEVLLMHKKKYGYQIQSQTLGYANIFEAIRELPYVEIIEVEAQLWIICHLNDSTFRNQSYRVCRIILNAEPNLITKEEVLENYHNIHNEMLKENTLFAMKHAVEMKHGSSSLLLTRLMRNILKVIKVVDQYKSLTLGEIKKYLSINLGDCFGIGYPNLPTFIRAYPDVFNLEVNSLIDRSKVTLVSSCDLLQNASKPQSNQQMMAKHQEKNNFSLSSSLTLNSSGHSIDMYTKNVIKEDLKQQQSNGHHTMNNNDNFIKNYLENEKENQYANKFTTQSGGVHRYPPGLGPLSVSSNAAYNYAGCQNADFNSQNLMHQHHQYQCHNMMPSFYGGANGKDNSFNVSLNSSNISLDLNSSSLNLNLNCNPHNLSLSNGSANSVTSSYDGMNLSNEANLIDINNNHSNGNNLNHVLVDFPKLWTDGSTDYFNNNLNYSETDDIFGLLKTSKTANINHTESNKASMDHLDLSPFLADPIWGNDAKHSDLSHDQKNSTIKDPTKFDIPDLQSFNVILPMLLSPYQQLSDSENMNNNMFSNDSADKHH